MTMRKVPMPAGTTPVMVMALVEAAEYEVRGVVANPVDEDEP
jgi:hypothetical protein